MTMESETIILKNTDYEKNIFILFTKYVYLHWI